ncbi:alpha-xylosidase [Limosilactobacillus sp.]|uniref:alpha-xylosidase n=1 Tax=Limosilactobacillus sp. TaxID=2773925 RepID=UPI00345EF1C2
MKFTNGLWLVRDNFSIQSPHEVYDYHLNEDQTKATLFAPYAVVHNRSQMNDLGGTTIDVTSPQENIIGIKLTHFDQLPKGPSFHLNDDQKKLDVNKEDQSVSFTSGKLTAKFSLGNKAPFDIKFIGDGKLLTESVDGMEGEIKDTKNHKHYMREALNLDVNENVYGLGERFTNFVKNGQSVNIVNKDAGTGSEQTYKNIPFYMTNHGYGVFVDQPENVSFEVASEYNDKVQFSVEGESIQYYIVYGPTAKDILGRYTLLTGRPALPPSWSFGLWLTTSFTTDYSEKTVLSIIDKMKENDVPLDVFHFDCFWMKGFEWTSFEWDKDMFPDPAGLIKKIHDRGIKVCVWLNPYISQKSRLFKEARDKGYLIKRHDGNPWQWDLWQPGNAFVDFTNPAAVKWYKGYLHDLLKMGVDVFKTDFGERIPVKDAVFYDGSDPKRMHNYYTYLYNKAVFESIQEVHGEKAATVFARSATVGSQKFPVHWGGDSDSRYTSMAASLRGGLSFMSSGFGFWSHDIGGFNDHCPADLYKRWTQFGLLSTHSRYHGSTEYRVPWHYGEEAVKVSRKFVKNKLSLMPYLYSQAVATHESGYPMMRPMFMEFPDDASAQSLGTQYMLGDDLLVAPIFNDRSEAHYYLPAGHWTNTLTGKDYDVDHGQWFDEKYDYMSLPLLAKQDSILLTNPQAEHAEYDYLSAPEVHVYQPSEGHHSQAVVDENGEHHGEITVDVKDGQLTIDVSPLKSLPTLFLHIGGDVKKVELTDKKQTISL